MAHPIRASRRNVFPGASALIAAFATPAVAKAPRIGIRVPAVYRFKVGAIEATTVSDGPLDIGGPKPDFSTSRRSTRR